MTGFEPAAPTTLKWCANRAAPHPELGQIYYSNRNIEDRTTGIYKSSIICDALSMSSTELK